MKTAVFTIASRNYFAFVRTLMNSLEKSNPDWERHVVVVDEIGEEFEKIPRNFNLVDLNELNLPGPEKMKFRYTIMEFNTAVKPCAILRLFEEYDRVVYIDPDIYVYEKMQEVEDAWDKGYDFVLTPHFTGYWDEDGCMPDEPAIMRAGVYNLGFIALNKCPETIEMVKWWADKLEEKCVVDIPEGIFVDQKWIDLVPGRYDKVFILRHEGYNIAYWNLSHRTPELRDGKYYFNGQRLVFFHYSGFNPRDMVNFSKHQNRFTLNDMGVAKKLFEDYAAEALSNDFDMWKKFKYSFANFSDGRPVFDVFRYAYRESKELQKKCGDNPFARPEIFYKEERAYIADFILKYIWKSRPDLQQAFTAPESEAYLDWARLSIEREYGISAKYFAGAKVKNPVEAAPAEAPVAPAAEAQAAPEATVVMKAEKPKKSVKVSAVRHSVKLALYEKIPAPIWKMGSKIYRSINPRKEPAAFTFDDSAYEEIEVPAPVAEAPAAEAPVAPVQEAKKVEKKQETLKDGVNLIGYIRSEHGVGEACRLTASCLDTTALDWAAYDYEVGNPSRQEDGTWDRKLEDKIQYNISIFNVNADQMPVAKQHLPKEAWKGYNIGIWYWELMEFPDMWCDAFDLVDEIWAPTKFVAEALERKATCPVIYMPPGIERNQPDPKFDRKHFGLPEDAFLFLNMFDSFSFSSRKNPTAAVKAFKDVFAPDDMSVGMVLKINNLKMLDEKAKEFEELKGEHKNIYIMAETLSREEVNGLLNTCDVAVSLHRSEGLGLLCEEAMFYGKPVIATGWSGNMDFMTEDTSCVVDYELRPIGQDVGPYKKWQRWADADVAQASEYMKKLYEDRDYYETISKKAKAHLEEHFSPKVCGARMEKRIKEIQQNLK